MLPHFFNHSYDTKLEKIIPTKEMCVFLLKKILGYDYYMCGSFYTIYTMSDRADYQQVLFFKNKGDNVLKILFNITNNKIQMVKDFQNHKWIDVEKYPDGVIKIMKQ